ncbi:MAG: DUF4430 domain-containing protein [Clostridia bacterium]|nr:DUF4430 domain-containing protein [Oscillospiraceae bacterium]MBQ6701588.1 DUF4430 domain-containing protein [Clostridia bacterium]
MKKTETKRLLSVILCTVLIAAMALLATGCTNSSEDLGNETKIYENPQTVDQTNGEPDETSEENAETNGEVEVGAIVLGEGEKKFDFNVVYKDGTTTQFVIHTDKKTVGEALIELELLEGEEGPYGLYVKKVNGITADYDIDQTYWGFYIDGEYAMTGVEKTEIEDGKVYSFKVSK